MLKVKIRFCKKIILEKITFALSSVSIDAIILITNYQFLIKSIPAAKLFNLPAGNSIGKIFTAQTAGEVIQHIFTGW